MSFEEILHRTFQAFHEVEVSLEKELAQLKVIQEILEWEPERHGETLERLRRHQERVMETINQLKTLVPLV